MNLSDSQNGSSKKEVNDFVSSGIPDSEMLYRGVPDDELYFPEDVNGVRRVSQMAFNDRACRPSVDIASLCDNDPNYTSKLRGPGVLGITAELVRTISSIREVKTESGGTIVTTYYADVCYEPLDDNIAHGVIYGKPDFDSGNLFRRIKEALARESEWLVKPSKLV